jgi:hypothetical protein
MDQIHLNLNISLVHLSFYLIEHLNDQDEQQQLLHQAKKFKKLIIKLNKNLILPF